MCLISGPLRGALQNGAATGFPWEPVLSTTKVEVVSSAGRTVSGWALVLTMIAICANCTVFKGKILSGFLAPQKLSGRFLQSKKSTLFHFSRSFNPALLQKWLSEFRLE
jgi:hypothetical protein